MHIRTVRVLIAAFVISVALNAQASQNITNDLTVWSVSYDGDYLPNNPLSDPAWSMAGSGSVSGGLLTFTAPGSFADMANPTYWNGGSGGTYDNTVMFRMRVATTAAPDWRGRAVMNNGQNQWDFRFSDAYFYFNGIPVLTNMAVFRTFRIVQTGNFADLYMDDRILLSGVAGNPTAANEIYFGQDITSTASTTEWDYFCWTNAGAFIPEPSAVALVSMALVGLIVHRRRA